MTTSDHEVDQSRPPRTLSVALVNMPWADTYLPSIQCALLKAGLERYGHRVDVHYLNLELAQHVGPAVYDSILSWQDKRVGMIGEWLFTRALYGDDDEPDDDYLAGLPELPEPMTAAGLSKPELYRLRRDTLPAWLARLLEVVSWEDYDLVGFTSTFEQNIAALALARRLKQAHPHVTTIFGGANFDGEMGEEYLRAFPFVDFSVSGEGDLVLPAFVARLSRGSSPLGLQGVVGRENGAVLTGGRAPTVENLDLLPTPDYSDYFDSLERLGRASVLGAKRPVTLPYEASRGCWWGEKHHCTFCGLNALGMGYRAKTPERVVDELTTLAQRHRIRAFDAVDNILDTRHASSLCDVLNDVEWNPRLFFEVKANLSRDQVRALKGAGVHRIQPGIESLSSRVLSLMRKGSTLLTNVALLKWCRYYGIDVAWNLLLGAPGESDEDCTSQAELVPLLTHLQPPQTVSRIWLDRFSPYFTGDWPIHDVRPVDPYRAIYPIAEIDLDKVAYFFDYQADCVASAAASGLLEAAVGEWRERWEAGPVPVLMSGRGPDFLSIVDSRRGRARLVTLDGWAAAAYESCSDSPQTLRRMKASLEQRSVVVDDERLTAFLTRCTAEGLMLCEDGRYLGLALPEPGER